MGAADRVQAEPQFADAGLAGAQPAEQGGVLALVVQSVGGQAQAHTSIRAEKERQSAPDRGTGSIVGYRYRPRPEGSSHPSQHVLPISNRG
ncbi:hypothetical protein K8O61_00685 [Xanthomonas cerealis pv. cerealis]|uniref:hypothetical protein n=1 Tax=Xanthomonas cerealis TaxID=3390025 RepID=UPI001F357DD3|nr:hypothetical protein [Xanthomonas translucens]UKE71438.1 hypothetical protein K8O61_00685 [Xanthomonas translucens pv. pistacia]